MNIRNIIIIFFLLVTAGSSYAGIYTSSSWLYMKGDVKDYQYNAFISLIINF